jgi:hypothetical protein
MQRHEGTLAAARFDVPGSDPFIQPERGTAMAGVHAVEGTGTSHGSGPEQGSENFEDGSSGNVFGISSEWADAQGNVKATPTNGHSAGQQGMREHGEQLNLNELAESAKAMGMSEQDITKFVDDFTSNPENFQGGQTEDQKRVGAAVALNEMIAAENINHLGLGEDELRKVSGDAVEAAKDNDGPKLRQILEDAGGNVGNMTDQQLLNTWSTNAHDNNHPILKGDAFQLTHLRSISSPDAADGSGSDPRGYQNDKQDFTQWGAPQAANNFLRANPIFG